MRILVTGGAGFIGSHLCENLIAMDNEVIIIDDLSAGNMDNIGPSLKSLRFFHNKLEDFNLDNLEEIDAVVHLAAQASVPLSISNFYESSKTNLLGAIKVIDYCSKNTIPLVYASSSAIYGGLSMGSDELDELDILSPYAADKYALEIYSKVAYSISGLSSIGLRFFNVYGPRQDPHNPYSGVISIFAHKLMNNQPITINGGTQTRDFIFVKDIVQVITKAIHKAKSNNICESVNVLTGNSISIDQLADALMKLLEVNGERVYESLPLGDPEESNGSISRLIEILDANPNNFTTIEDGLKLTIDYIKNGDC